MGLFRKRDLAVLVLISISLYLSYFESPGLTYSIDPAWFIDQNAAGGSGNKAIDYNVVRPIITDLEGDGVNEVIMITDDMKLKVYSADIPPGDNTEVYHPEEVFAVDLPNTHTLGRTPVALKTGYIHPYSDTEKRSQVIVVLFEDWTVVCYDSSLHVLWTKQVAHKTFDLEHLVQFYHIHSAAIHIAPLQLRDDMSDGVVIVGASMRRRDGLFHPDGSQVTVEEMMLRRLSDGNIPDAEAISRLEHFSIFALDGFSGHVIWKHDGMEVRVEQYSRSLPQHAYTLNLKDLMTKTHRAAGINDWTVFRQSLIDELPHTWAGVGDTTMRIAHFVRRHVGATMGPAHPIRTARKKKNKGVAPAKRGEHAETARGKGRNGRPAVGLASSLPLLHGEVQSQTLSKAATLPHDAEEHIVKPNVIAVHTDKGIEVVALRTGTPVTSLALAPNRVYADVDGDGVVDTIAILDSPRSVAAYKSEFAHHQYEYDQEGGSLQHCLLMVMSGLPARSQLFNGTICSERPSLRDSFAEREVYHADLVREPPSLNPQAGEHPGGKAEHSVFAHAIPLVLRKTDDIARARESKERDIVVAIHTGIVTSYTGRGNFNWQLRTGPKWGADEEELPEAVGASAGAVGNGTAHGRALRSRVAAAVVAFDADADRAVGTVDGHNTLYSDILIVGESALQLLSREGDTLAHADIPRPPIASPVLGDFDNDGVSDIIIVADGVILGYHVHVVRSGNIVLTAIMCLAALTVIVFVAHIQRVDGSTPLSGAMGGAAGAGRADGTRPGVRPDVLARQTATAAAVMSANSTLQARVPRSKAASGLGMFTIVRSTDDHLD